MVRQMDLPSIVSVTVDRIVLLFLYMNRNFGLANVSICKEISHPNWL